MDALPPSPPAIYASAPAQVYVCKRWGWSSDRQYVWCLKWVIKDDK
jgi:hypothetical protein